MARWLLELAPGAAKIIFIKLYHASVWESKVIRDARLLKTPVVWCSDQAGCTTETLRKVDQWQRALQMDPAPSQAAQAACNVALAAIPAWQNAISFLLRMTGRLPGPLKGKESEWIKYLVKGVLSSFSSHFASRHVEGSPLSLKVFFRRCRSGGLGLKIPKTGQMDPPGSDWNILKLWNQTSRGSFDLDIFDIFGYLFMAWKHLKAILSPTRTWKDGSQLHHHPSRHKPLGNRSPPKLGGPGADSWNCMEFPDLVFRSFFSFLDMRNDPSEGICAEQPIVRCAIDVRSFPSRGNVSVSSHQNSRSSEDAARRASSGSQLCFFARTAKAMEWKYCRNSLFLYDDHSKFCTIKVVLQLRIFLCRQVQSDEKVYSAAISACQTSSAVSQGCAVWAPCVVKSNCREFYLGSHAVQQFHAAVLDVW